MKESLASNICVTQHEQHVHQRAHLPALASQQLEHGLGDEAQRQAVGDGEGQRYPDDGENAAAIQS